MIDDPKKDEEKEKIAAAEEKVLFPETHTIDANFMEHKLKLRPLPISYARKINRLLSDLQDMLSTAAKSSDDKEVQKTLKHADIQAADGLMDSVIIILSFYKIDATRVMLEEKVSTQELVALAHLQTTINGSNDFLLQPLRTIIAIASASGEIMAQVRSSLSTLVSQRVGGSVSKNSSTVTPTDN